MTYKRAVICWSLGAGLLCFAVWMPDSWFAALPAGELRGGIPTGETLLRMSLLLEALVLFWLASPRSTPGRLGEADRAPVLFTDREKENLRSRGWILGAITLFALILRCYRLDADLWLDEIITVIRHCPRSVWELLTVYPGSNNHLLNTLLVKAGITWFGEKEWAIRLPAVIFGTATIPACYWLARMAMSTRASLAAALLLAVSYHHIFYSQNARGCAGSLLSLTSYYAAPKQDFRSAIRYLQRETGPEDLIIVLDLAEAGFRYYGLRTGFMAWKDYYAADSLQALDALLSAHPGKPSYWQPRCSTCWKSIIRKWRIASAKAGLRSAIFREPWEAAPSVSG